MEWPQKNQVWLFGTLLVLEPFMGDQIWISYLPWILTRFILLDISLVREQSISSKLPKHIWMY